MLPATSSKEIQVVFAILILAQKFLYVSTQLALRWNGARYLELTLQPEMFRDLCVDIFHAALCLLPLASAL